MKTRTKNSKTPYTLLNRSLSVGLAILMVFFFFPQEKVFSQDKPIGLSKEKIQQNTNDIKQLFNQGRALQINGKHFEAEKKFKEILQVEPEHFQSHVQLGMLYKKQERYRDAVVEFKKALTIQPNSLAHKNLGIIYSKLGENRKAVKEFEAAIKINPNLENIHYLLGKILFHNKLENHQRVIEEFKKALKANPQRWEASFALGLVYKSQKLYREAIPFFEEVVALKPDFADGFYQLGHMYIAVKEGKAAITHLLKAEKLYKKKGNKQKVNLSNKYLKKLFKKFDFKRSDFN